MSTVTNTVQQFTVTDARSVVVTDIVKQADGSYIRQVRIYGDPFVDGAPSLLLTMNCISANHDDLVVTVPTAVNY